MRWHWAHSCSPGSLDWSRHYYSYCNYWGCYSIVSVPPDSVRSIIYSYCWVSMIVSDCYSRCCCSASSNSSLFWYFLRTESFLSLWTNVSNLRNNLEYHARCSDEQWRRLSILAKPSLNERRWSAEHGILSFEFTWQEIIEFLCFHATLVTGLSSKDQWNVDVRLWTDCFRCHDQLFDLLAHFLFAQFITIEIVGTNMKHTEHSKERFVRSVAFRELTSSSFRWSE